MPIQEWKRPIVKSIGVALMAIAFAVCGSHIIGRSTWLRLPGKPADPGMAFLTGVCFGLTGTALFTIARKEP